MSGADKDLDAPLQTILDLWYARTGGRDVRFSIELVYDCESDDWLMQNMALVVSRVVRKEGELKSVRGWVSDITAVYPPFVVVVSINKAYQDFVVCVKEIDSGNTGEQGAAPANS